MQEIKQETTRSRKGKREQSGHPLPPIPGKRYFTVSEAANLCGVKPHVLRYWEQEFTQLSPAKRRGNRRYYQEKDILLIRQIRGLLYENGFTIEGARTQLASSSRTSPKMISQLIKDLENILQNLRIG